MDDHAAGIWTDAPRSRWDDAMPPTTGYDGPTRRGGDAEPHRAPKPALLILGTRGIPAAYGGFETFAEKLALYLTDRGWDVTVYCQQEVTVESGLDGAVGVDVWRGVRRVAISVAGSGPRSTVAFDLRAARHARGQDGVRLVLGYNTACFLPLLHGRGEAVVTNMDGIEWKRDKWPLYAKAWFLLNERLACRLSTALVADHPEIHAHHAKHSRADKITMIPYGADPIETAPTAPLERYGLRPGRFVVTIARIEPENSILEMVRAYSCKERPYAMVCVGGLDPERNRYHARIRDAASSQVMFPGAIYDKGTIASIRRHALAYLHGHTVGGTNPSLVEALGAGSAVVAHANKYNRWTAGPGQFYFETEDECREIFDRLADDDAALARARAAAARRHRAAFTWDGVLQAYETLCSRLSKTRVGAALLALAVAAALARPAPARADYLLGAGDRLEITVMGSPARRASVNADGQIAMPQIGNVALAGLSLPAAQLRLKEQYRESGIFQNADVVVEVVEYRPFYIDGDVAKPGAYPYQPNLTVREAVALAGGLDMVRFRFGENPFLRAADLRNEHETIAIDRLRLTLRRLHVAAELEGKPEADLAGVDRRSVDPAAFRQLADSEREQMRQRRASHEAELASLEAAINEAQQNFNALTAQLAAETESAKQEERQVALTRSNVERGAAPQMRMAEVQRAYSSAQSRHLATQAQVWTAQRSVSEYRRQLARVQEARRAALLQEAQEAEVALQKIASQTKAAAEKFEVVAGARAAFYLRPGDEADISIYRKNGPDVAEVPGVPDSDVVAGDVIEIRLRPKRLLGTAATSPARP